MFKLKKQQGFTLMEIVVATTIFASALTIMLALFNYTLQINRRVDAQRQSAQGTRNLMEYLVREIRNGKVDYLSSQGKCTPNYYDDNNAALAIINQAGELECFYAADNNLYIVKGEASSQLNPTNMSVDSSTFRFIVRPSENPDPENPPYSGVQPFVTIMAKFQVNAPGVANPIVLPYQTVISPDVYDIPHEG